MSDQERNVGGEYVENLDFDDWLAEELKNSEFRRAYEALEPAYQVARLRLRQGLSQRELAERAGTQQPHIARLESGRGTPSLSFLRRVVQAMGGSVQIIVRDPEGRPVADVSELCGGAPLSPGAHKRARGGSHRQTGGDLSHQGG
jgi:DNA-binding XRE family transcriptional regulator